LNLFNAIVGGIIPREFIQPIQEGFEEAEKWPLASYPLLGVQ